MGRPNPIAQTWWVLYPYYGLKIEDENHGLESPMFDHFHVMSRQHIPELSEGLKLRLFSKADALGEEYDSLLAVRNTSESSEIYDATKPDADIFGAIMSVATFSDIESHYASSLFEKLTRSEPQNRLAVSLVAGISGFASHMERVKSPTVIFGVNRLPYTRQQLKSLLLSEDLGFGDLLLKTLLPGELCGRLRAAIILFDEALRQRDYSLQILGCLTVIECLFKNGAGYAIFQSRLQTVLGEIFCDNQKLSEVISLRHDFVHEGKRITEQGFTYKTLTLALSSIIAYSNLAPEFFDYASLISSVDLPSPYMSSRIEEGLEKISRIPRLKNLAVPKKMRDYYASSEGSPREGVVA